MCVCVCVCVCLCVCMCVCVCVYKCEIKIMNNSRISRANGLGFASRMECTSPSTSESELKKKTLGLRRRFAL